MSGSKRLKMRTVLGLLPVVVLAGMAALRGVNVDPAPFRLEVNLSARELKVVENGNVTRTYGIAVGRADRPTPQGSFVTGRIVWNPSWKPPNAKWARNKTAKGPDDPENPMQGVKIYFKAPDYYIHGTNAPASIGSAASHGCIRMTEEDAKALARRIQKAGGSVPLLIKG
jgi:lipoprotein-anchoring transpeptidase ErfK/SrfK